MIIQNGTIQVKLKASASPTIDPETGYPRKAVEVCWSEPIPCQFVARDYSNLTRVQGEAVRLAKYDIFIEECPCFSAEQVRLEDLVRGVIGEFSVIEAEPLPAVGQIRLRV